MGAPFDRSFSERVRRALSSYEPKRTEIGGLRSASVLLALFASEVPRAPALWLLRRPDGSSAHSGQVALPGGKPEPSDTGPLATALREAHEEIGLPPSYVEVLGVLDDLPTITGFLITPFVGWVDRPFTPMPHAGEVARVFSAPLAAFAEEPTSVSVPWGSSERRVLSYEVEGEIVWGATAAILRHFVEVITPSLARFSP